MIAALRQRLERDVSPRVVVVGFVVFLIAVACVWSVEMFGPSSYEQPRDVTPQTVAPAVPASIDATQNGERP